MNNTKQIISTLENCKDFIDGKSLKAPEILVYEIKEAINILLTN